MLLLSLELVIIRMTFCAYLSTASVTKPVFYTADLWSLASKTAYKKLDIVTWLYLSLAR